VNSEHSSEPDPRKKRALIIGGVIAVGAILWNVEDWTDNDPPVHITVRGDDDGGHATRDAIREGIREEIRATIRGDDEPQTENAVEEEAEAAEPDEAPAAETATSERRVVETASGENQRTFRIEGDDGRGVTISVDGDSTN
jgi:hypothetical protein